MNASMPLPSRPATPLLDRVRVPSDLRNFSAEQLRQVADELRAETVDAVSTTGGHLGASLGVVELTVALHAIFDTPRDRLIWDVGHQAYPHKILTGRRDRIRTLRQPGGLSASPAGRSRSTTRSVRRIAARASPPASAWRSRTAWRARRTAMWSP